MRLFLPDRLVMIICAAALTPAFAPCDAAGEERSFIKSIVLTPGDRIEAVLGKDKIAIEWAGPLERIVEWDGKREKVEVIPRLNPMTHVYRERWTAVLGGVYQPAGREAILGKAGRIIGYKGPFRILYQEGEVWCDSPEALQAFLHERGNGLPCVHSSDGIVVSFIRPIDGLSIDVMLFKILLRGQVVNDLEGAQNEAMTWKKTEVK